MKAKTILYDDIADIRISSLPSHPTAPRALGGMGYSSKEMKAAFDKLPLYIIERYNALIEDIGDVGEDSLAAAVPTGIKKRHTLSNLFDDIVSGELATYFNIFGESLISHLIGIKNDIDSLKTKVNDLEKLVTGAPNNENSEYDTMNSIAVENDTIDGATAENGTMDSAAVENDTIDGATAENGTVDSAAVENDTIDGATAEYENSESTDEPLNPEDEGYIPDDPESESESSDSDAEDTASNSEDTSLTAECTDALSDGGNTDVLNESDASTVDTLTDAVKTNDGKEEYEEVTVNA